MIRVGCARDLDRLVEIDNDASTLFERAGLRLEAARESELVAVERDRWSRCLSAGTVLIAVNPAGEDVGFAAVGLRDAQPYLDQLSVRVNSMGQGIGTDLLYRSMTVALGMGGGVLWLTTYSHLSWNRPFYERYGFVVVPPQQCGEELRRELQFERGILPSPEERVIMRRDLATGQRPRGTRGH
jgi:GNAT superfamily N-acetyltransferase